MGNECSKLQMDQLKTAINLFKETVKLFRKSSNNLVSISSIKKALEAIQKIHDFLDEEEKKALKQILNADEMTSLALHDAEIVVIGLRETIRTILQVINGSGTLDEKVKLAMQIFIEDIDDLVPKLEKARDSLMAAKIELIKVANSLEYLKNWCDRKVKELETKKVEKIVKERAAAYGGAAGAAVAVSGGAIAVVNFWNPIGWIVGAVAAGVGTAVSFGVAAGVAEGVTIKDLRETYDSGIDGLTTAKGNFDEMANTADDNVKSIEDKRMRMLEIVAVARSSNKNGRRAITIDVNVDMFKIFQEDVIKLNQLCDDYFK